MFGTGHFGEGGLRSTIPPVQVISGVGGLGDR